MAIASVKKIAIYGLQSERERLLQTLQNSGLLELAVLTSEATEATGAVAKVTAELQGDTAAVDRHSAAVVRALAFLDRIDPVKPNLIQQFAGIKTYLAPQEFLSLAQDTGRCQAALTRLGQLEAELAEIQAKRLQLQSLLDNLLPWRALDLPYASLQGTATTKVILGSVNLPFAVLEAGLAAVPDPFYLEPVSGDNNAVLFVIFLGAVARETVPTALARLNVAQVTLPVYESTVAAQIDQWQRELVKLSAAETQVKETVRGLANERIVLQVFYDVLSDERNRLEAAQQLLHAERSFGLSGWIIADRCALLEQKLSQAKLHYVIIDIVAQEGEQPPTVLQNNQLVHPFEYLVQSFSYPQSGEVDPTPSIAPFFFLFFGIALGDAGYGLILAVICGILLVKLKMGPVGKKLSWMFLISGIGAILVGILTGSVLSLENIKFGVFNPLENPILLLVIALCLGLVQLYYGLLISAYYTIREGKWLQMLANQGTLIFFLTSVILFLAKDAIGLKQYGSRLVWLLELATAGMVIGNMYGKKGLVAKLTAIPGGFYNIYSTIGFFSDVLSYSRLMALGLSGGVMGGIMNQLAGMVFNSLPVLGWIFGAAIFLFGHALNFALSVLGAYVHSSRLQYLEFFSKFFEGGGRPFSPFTNKPKYTFLVNEREA